MILGILWSSLSLEARSLSCFGWRSKENSGSWPDVLMKLRSCSRRAALAKAKFVQWKVNILDFDLISRRSLKWKSRALCFILKLLSIIRSEPSLSIQSWNPVFATEKLFLWKRSSARVSSFMREGHVVRGAQ